MFVIIDIQDSIVTNGNSFTMIGREINMIIFVHEADNVFSSFYDLMPRHYIDK